MAHVKPFNMAFIPLYRKTLLSKYSKNDTRYPIIYMSGQKARTDIFLSKTNPTFPEPVISGSCETVWSRRLKRYSISRSKVFIINHWMFERTD